MKLLNIDQNAKTVKGQKKGYITAILYLAPSDLSGYNVCSNATPGCILGCLNKSGYGIYDRTQKSRIAKTKYFFNNRQAFLSQLEKEIKNFIKLAKKKDLIPCIRLNGTSDLAFEQYGIIQKFPDIQFYDYTKNYIRMLKYCNNELPKNYHLTFSRSELNDKQCNEILKLNGSVAIVFSKKLYEHWDFNKKYMVNGELNDLRFLDKPKSIIALKAKGKAKKDSTGFVVVS